jgi:hypothetical protein
MNIIREKSVLSPRFGPCRTADTNAIAVPKGNGLAGQGKLWNHGRLQKWGNRLGIAPGYSDFLG